MRVMTTNRTIYISLFLLVFIVQHASVKGEASCGYIKGPDGYYYRFVNKYYPWHIAKATCEKEGAQLAIYYTSDTSSYIKDAYALDYTPVWIGASFTDSINKWRWLDQSVIEEKYWLSSYRAHDHGCGVMKKDYLIGSESCFGYHPFLCQKKEADCSATSAVTKCGELSKGPTCKPYHCYLGAGQYGYDISFRRAESLEECAKYCCQVPSPNCRCAGFDWVESTRQCALSETPRSVVALTVAPGVYSCEWRKVPGGFVSGYEGSYFKMYTQEVNWERANESCNNDKAHLVEVDGSKKKLEYLMTTMGWKRFWTGKKCTALDNTNADPTASPLPKQCTSKYPFVCEIPMKTVDKATYQIDEKRWSWAHFPWWIIGVVFGFISVLIRIAFYMRYKNRRARAFDQQQNQAGGALVVPGPSHPAPALPSGTYPVQQPVATLPAGTYPVQQALPSGVPPTAPPPPYEPPKKGGQMKSWF